MPIPLEPDRCPVVEEHRLACAEGDCEEHPPAVLRADGRWQMGWSGGGSGANAIFTREIWLVDPSTCAAAGALELSAGGSPSSEVHLLRPEGTPCPDAATADELRRLLGDPGPVAFPPIPPLPALFGAPRAGPDGLTLRVSRESALAWREGAKVVGPPLVFGPWQPDPADCDFFLTFDGPSLKAGPSGTLGPYAWRVHQTEAREPNGALLLLDPEGRRHAWLWIDLAITPLGEGDGRAWFLVQSPRSGEPTLVSAWVEEGAPRIQSVLFEGPVIEILGLSRRGVLARIAGEEALLRWRLLR